MCLAIPMKIIKIEDNLATAEINGAKFKANIDLVPDVKIGEYIIVHAGFAIEKLDEESAMETLKIWQDVADFHDNREKR